MATFDQRGQHVRYQYNAARDINLGSMRTSADLVQVLQQLTAEVDRAKEAQALDPEVATDVEYRITKARQQAQKPTPDNQGILHHLAEAKTLVEGVTAAGGSLTGLVVALGQVADQVQHINF